MGQRVALITGVNGQDGSYLAELLLEKGYLVHGLVRRTSLEAPQQRLKRILHLLDRIELHTSSLESCSGIQRVMRQIRPDECYHLAAASFVSYQFDEDELSGFHANVDSTLHLLSALREAAPSCRFYFAGTSEMFGSARQSPQNEGAPFSPRSLYGISKVAGFDITRNYRQRNKIHASTGILYNHESPRRGSEFVTQKIAGGAARAKAGLIAALQLGNLDARRDWGHARDYVRAMWLMLQQENPIDLVIATGITHSVRDFCDRAFGRLGLSWQDYVTSDPRLYRESEQVVLCGDATRARQLLGWRPEYDFDQLVAEMTDAAAAELRPEREESATL